MQNGTGVFPLLLALFPLLLALYIEWYLVLDTGHCRIRSLLLFIFIYLLRRQWSSVILAYFAESDLAESRFAESCFAESRFAESRFAESRFAESRFAESRFAE